MNLYDEVDLYSSTYNFCRSYVYEIQMYPLLARILLLYCLEILPGYILYNSLGNILCNYIVIFYIAKLFLICETEKSCK